MVRQGAIHVMVNSKTSQKMRWRAAKGIDLTFPLASRPGWRGSSDVVRALYTHLPAYAPAACYALFAPVSRTGLPVAYSRTSVVAKPLPAWAIRTPNRQGFARRATHRTQSTSWPGSESPGCQTSCFAAELPLWLRRRSLEISELMRGAIRSEHRSAAFIPDGSEGLSRPRRGLIKIKTVSSIATRCREPLAC